MIFSLSVSEAITHYGKFYPTKPAFIGEFNITYGELSNNIDIFTNFFLQKFGERKRIGIIVKDNSHFIFCLYGIIKSNNIFVSLNPYIEISDLKNICFDCECDYLITGTENYTSFEISKIPSFLTNDILVSNFPDAEPKQPFLIDDIAGILFSSGTTGIPKGIIKTHYSIFSELFMWMLELQINKNSSFLMTRPLFYTGGLLLTSTVLLAGGCIYLQNKIQPDELIKYVNSKKLKLDWAFLVPNQINQILNLPNKIANKKIAAKILVMGAPIDAKTKIKFSETFKCKVIESWGNTEGLGTINDENDLLTKPNSIGRTFIFDKMLIVDEFENDLGVNSIGNIAGFSDNLFLSYVNGKLKYNEITISDDLGYLDSDGYFYIVGRVTDVINLDEKKIYPLEIEAIIKHLSNIKDVSVLGIKLDNGNMLPIAFIEYDGTLNKTELLKEINERLNNNIIEEILFIDKIPRNQGGKVLKSDLVLIYKKIKNDFSV